MKKFYVTTAIDYTNAPPHIGHALEKIQADVLARWHRLKGKKVFYLTGVDEHGQKVEQAAKRIGLNPKGFVDSISPQFEHAWRMLDISFDKFIRTTDPKHKSAATELIKRVARRGDIYKDKYEGYYCEGCERFYTERELEQGVCPTHKRKCQILKEDAYFFRLSKYEKALLSYYKKPIIVPAHRQKEVLNRIKEGLKDVCITRKIKWGIPFPLNKKFVTYVWFDALPNYITALGWPRGKNFKIFWPADVHCIGKDILWFHAVIWPAILMSAKLKLPERIFVHGHMKVEGEKISKSLGNVIDPRDLIRKYGSDSLRYFLLREIPSYEDGDFSEHALVERNNAELADQFGNLVHRIFTFVHKRFNSKVPSATKILDEDKELIETCLASPALIDKLINEFKFHHVLEEIWKLIEHANAYMNATEPWRQDDIRAGTIIYNLLECLRFITILSEPFIPAASLQIADALGMKLDLRKLNKFGLLKPGKKIKPLPILFKKHPKPLKRITMKDFQKLDLRIAEILHAKHIEGSKKLIQLHVNVGEEKTIIAGIYPEYEPEQLVGKQIVLLNNIEPKMYKQFNLVSEGMLLAADEVLLVPEKKVKAGTKVV